MWLCSCLWSSKSRLLLGTRRRIGCRDWQAAPASVCMRVHTRVRRLPAWRTRRTFTSAKQSSFLPSFALGKSKKTCSLTHLMVVHFCKAVLLLPLCSELLPSFPLPTNQPPESLAKCPDLRSVPQGLPKKSSKASQIASGGSRWAKVFKWHR